MAGAATLKTGLNVFQPLSYAKSRDNVAVMTNGCERPIVWNGISDTTYEAGIDAPSAAPTVTASGSGNGASTGTYQCAYRYVQAWSPSVYSSISALVEVSATSGNKFTWTVAFGSGGQLARQDLVQLYRSTAGQAITLYKVVELGRTGSITSSASDGGGSPKVVFTVPTGHNLAVGAIFTVASHVDGASSPLYIGSHTVTATTATTLTTDVAYTANGTGGTWTLTGFSSDTATDASLQTNEALRITNPDTSVNARRQTAPPNHKPYVCIFQDRAFYAGWIPYTAGSISNSGTTVTGSSTAWTDAMDGRYMLIAGETKARLIDAVGGATSITLASVPSATYSGVAYAIFPSQEERNQVYFSSPDEPESVAATNVIAVQENTGDDDVITGLLPDGAYLYALKERHIYRIAYYVQPNIDVAVVLVARRGCVNNRCHCTLQDTAYLMDQQGIWAFSGGKAIPISDPIDDLFRDGTIDWSDSKWFWAIADPTTQTVRFHVTYTTDTATRPVRWLEYNTRTKTWNTNSFPGELGGGCLVDISGRTRVLVGGENEYVYIDGQGVYDQYDDSAVGVRTITSVASLPQITVGGTAFTVNALIGAPIGVLTGTGKMEWKKITANGANTITATWGTNPAVGDTVFVGAIKWNLKTGDMRLPPTGGGAFRQVRMLYRPTTNAASLDIRRWVDFATDAEAAWSTTDRGKGITTTKDSKDAVLDMKKTRTSLGDAPGLGIYEMPGRTDDYSQGQRQLAIELRGFQTLDAIEIQTLDVVGAVE